MSEYVQKTMNEYLSIKDSKNGVTFLLNKIVEAGKANQVEDVRELCSIGHTVLEKSGVTKEEDPFVHMATILRIYCWICNQMILGPNVTYAVQTCPSCSKTFCPSHIKKGFLKKARCPLCGGNL